MGKDRVTREPHGKGGDSDGSDGNQIDSGKQARRNSLSSSSISSQTMSEDSSSNSSPRPSPSVQSTRSSHLTPAVPISIPPSTPLASRRLVESSEKQCKWYEYIGKQLPRMIAVSLFESIVVNLLYLGLRWALMSLVGITLPAISLPVVVVFFGLFRLSDCIFQFYKTRCAAAGKQAYLDCYPEGTASLVQVTEDKVVLQEGMGASAVKKVPRDFLRFMNKVWLPENLAVEKEAPMLLQRKGFSETEIESIQKEVRSKSEHATLIKVKEYLDKRYRAFLKPLCLAFSSFTLGAGLILMGFGFLPALWVPAVVASLGFLCAIPIGRWFYRSRVKAYVKAEIHGCYAKEIFLKSFKDDRALNDAVLTSIDYREPLAFFAKDIQELLPNAQVLGKHFYSNLRHFHERRRRSAIPVLYNHVRNSKISSSQAQLYAQSFDKAIGQFMKKHFDNVYRISDARKRVWIQEIANFLARPLLFLTATAVPVLAPIIGGLAAVELTIIALWILVRSLIKSTIRIRGYHNYKVEHHTSSRDSLYRQKAGIKEPTGWKSRLFT